jgi:hypothetical protein
MADAQTDVTHAAQRLEKALAALEGRMRDLKAAKAEPRSGGLFPDPPADTARTRELEAAAAEASAALGRAADTMRAILNGEG